MSLLMDALKKAERDKTGAKERDTHSGAPPGTGRDLAAELGLEERPAAQRPNAAANTTSKTGISEFSSSLSLEPVTPPAPAEAAPSVIPPAPPPRFSAEAAPEANLQPAAAPRADRQGPSSTPGADRMTARTVFASKQPRANAISPFHATIAALLLACVGTGIYFWWQLRPVAPPPAKPLAAGAIAAPAIAAVPERSAPQIQPASVQPQSSQVLPGPATAVGPTAPVTATPAAPVAPPTTTPRAAVSEYTGSGTTATRPATASAKPPAPTGSRPSPPSATAQGGAQVESPAGLRITRNTDQATVDPAVSAGYAALIEGNDAAARDHYGRALAIDRNNRDALYGMATLAARAGRPEEAQSHYRRVLELNPRDAFAQAQLTALAGGGQAGDDGRVRALVAQQTDAVAGAPLSFTLGNRLAAQGRWAEAQQAYFDAFTAEPDNPDYCYNLAVALDQMHQTRQAKTYYERALDLSQKRRAGFDAERVRARLSAIAARQ